MRAHNDNLGNDIADQIAKYAALRRGGENAFSSFPKSVALNVIQGNVQLEWQKEWKHSKKGGFQKSYFYDIRGGKSKIIQMGIKYSAIVLVLGTQILLL